MDLLNQNQEQIQEQKEETTNTLAEILGSINTDTNNVNIVNYVEEEKTNEDETNNTNVKSQEIQETEKIQNLTTQIQLLTDTIDKRIGNYLLNELEKKQAYIDELEEAVKFQEKEISELKSKLEGLNKLELLSKIKSNMETKLVDVETNLHQIETDEKEVKSKVVSVKKSNQQIEQFKSKNVISDEQSQYPKSNPDLVFRSNTGTKVKSIPKEEEEPRYNGVMMLEKPKNEPVIKIQLDYETETGDNSSTMSDVVKQRRRARRL